VRVETTPLPGVLVVHPPLFRDDRGFFLEAWRHDRFEAAGIPDHFVQDNQSRSMAGTLRGLHWQWRKPQAKLVRVLSGRIFDAVVDVRRGSPHFGQWFGLEMNAEDFTSLYVPVGYAHGFCVLSDTAEVLYKCSDTYDPGGEGGLIWNEPAVGISWPIEAPTLSPRDQKHPRLDPSRADLLSYAR
jgi:dTDP-4-dehydrorhamnose 3,5-epimerase